MQITRAGVTVQPVAFQFGVVLLSGGGTGGGTGGSTGGSDVGGGGGGWFLAPLLLGLGALGGIAASAPLPAVPPAVSAGPSVISPGVGAAPAPLAVAATPPAVGAGAKASPSTPSPIVLAASAAQAKPVAVPAAVQAKQRPGLVLPYTGANLWLPFGAGSGLIGLGIWLRRLAGRFREE